MGSSSPPPTPSQEWPGIGSVDHRFLPVRVPGLCEPLEFYRPGGFHPVIIGDTLHEGRYRVIRKLGDSGLVSTVWLAVDREPSEHKYVSLELRTAKYSPTNKNELEMQSRVTGEVHRTGRQSHVLQLLNSFEETGPNGLHLCLVHKPAAVTVGRGIDSLPQYQNRQKKDGETRRYPKWMVKRILRHTLLGLTQLHALGIVHSDLRPGNLFFDAHDLDNTPEDALKQDIEKTTRKPTRLDGKEDKWAPLYLTGGQTLTKYADFGESSNIVISGLRNAFYLDQQPEKIRTGITQRAPETILKQKVDEKIDIWSFGILVYELLTKDTLFPCTPLPGYDSDSEVEDDADMVTFHQVLGDIPDSILALWPRSKGCIFPERKSWDALEDQGRWALAFAPLEVKFERNKPDYIDAEESKVIISLIRGILKYEPSERPTAETILQHEWFSQE